MSQKIPTNHTKYAALWLLDRGYSYAKVAEIHGVGARSVKRWAKNKEKIRDKNRDDLIKHFSSEP